MPLLRSVIPEKGTRQDGKAQKAGQARRTAKTMLCFLLSVKKQGMIHKVKPESF